MGDDKAYPILGVLEMESAETGIYMRGEIRADCSLPRPFFRAVNPPRMFRS